MDKMETMYWVAVLQQARQGSKEAQEVIQKENERRTKDNAPTVQEELTEPSHEPFLNNKN